MNIIDPRREIPDGPRSIDGSLANLKHRLVRARVSCGTEPGVERMTKLAATEAEALAWLTSYPLLVLPVLLDEKLDYVCRYTERQHRLLRRGASRAQ